MAWVPWVSWVTSCDLIQAFEVKKLLWCLWYLGDLHEAILRVASLRNVPNSAQAVTSK